MGQNRQYKRVFSYLSYCRGHCDGSPKVVKPLNSMGCDAREARAYSSFYTVHNYPFPSEIHDGGSYLIASFKASPHIAPRGAGTCQDAEPRPVLEYRQIVSQAQFGDIAALTQWGVRFSPIPRRLVFSYCMCPPSFFALCAQQGVLGNMWV